MLIEAMSGAPETESLASSGMAFRYPMYGFLVQSELPLPLVPAANADGLPTGWHFRLGQPGAMPKPDGSPVATLWWRGAPYTVLHRGPSGTWIWNRDAGTSHISRDLRQIVVYPEMGADERELCLYLIGQVSVFVVQQMGYPCLHASAVVTEQGAFGFLGDHEQGKSTMAAAFVRRGATLLADDALPLRLRPDGVYGGPGVSWMKVWPDTAHETFRRSDLPKLMPRREAFDKQLLLLDNRYRFAAEPARLRVLYVLERYEPARRGSADTTTRPLGPRERLTALLAQTSWRGLLQPAEGARLLSFYRGVAARVPVRVLSYPHGYEHQDAVCERILADLEVS